MDGVLEPRPKSSDLLVLIEHHTAALEYDFRTRFGLPVSALFNGGVTWREGWNLAQELLMDMSSHVYASVAGWRYAPPDVERMGLELFEAWMNTQRRKGSVPIVLKRPWKDGMTTGGAEVVDADNEERLDAIARLSVLTSEGPELPEPEPSSD